MPLAAIPMRPARRAPQRQALLVTGAAGQFVAIEELSADADPSEQLVTRAKRRFPGQRVQLVALTVLEEIS